MSAVDKTIDMLGIGNAILDILAHTEDAFLEEWGMRKGDMALIDENRAQAIYEQLGQTKEVSGGSVANSVAGLAMLGGSAAFIGRVKDDQFGKVYQHDLRSVGVKFDVPPLQEGNPTGCSYILVSPDGERTMNTYLGAGSEIYPDDIEEDLVAQSRVVFGEGYQWSGENNIAAMEKAFTLAKKHGTKVAFTLSAIFCVELYREQFKALLEDGIVDILFANEAEMQAMYPEMAWDAIVDHVQGKAEIIIITRSEQGSLIVTK
jgi:sugar/nucleoside kinase (ribokinase family)